MIPLAERMHLVTLFNEAVESGARKAQAVDVMGLPLRTLQRWQCPESVPVDGRTRRQQAPCNRLSDEERTWVLAVANSDEFKDKTPHQIVPILAERGEYYASESTFYRILREEKQVSHRHACRASVERSKPKALTATAPKQLVSWDITYLISLVKGQFFYLYLFMDIFSRKIVGWQVYEQESSELAADLVKDLCQREGIPQHQLVLHSDNGSPMKGATLLATLQQLGVTPSRSRPSVSNDNPYSESLFKTLKYGAQYPTQPFASLTDAREWATGFVSWYNHEHRHSSIQFVTPEQRHTGEDRAILKQRQAVYVAAKAQKPERWSRNTRNWDWQAEVCLNPDKPNDNAVKKTNTTVH
jgi:transposase InsO family protein